VSPEAQTSAAPQAPANEPAPFDSAAFETKLKERFGPEISLTNLDGHLEKLHKTNSKFGRELAEFKKANEPREEFWKMIDTNEPLRARLGQTVDEFFQENQQPGVQKPDFGVVSLEQRLNTIETQQLTARTDHELDQLAANDYPVTDEIRDEVQAAVLQSRGAFKAREVYMMKYGERVIALREQAAARAAVEALKQNNGSYVQAPSQRSPASPSTAPVDVSGMSSDEFAKHAVSQWKQVMGPRGW
jgi:hypothetical protein